MNPTLDLIANRRSIRAYTDQPVTQAEKDVILQAAMRAPTAGNMMLYSIIEVEDQSLKDKLAVSCDNQPFIARAPYVLLFLADYQRWYDLFLYSGIEKRCRELDRTPRHPQEGDLLIALCDALIAAQTAAIAAESLGLGSCYIGDAIENYETHRQLFDLPPYVLPITVLCIGHPAPAQLTRTQATRFDRRFIVHKNTYKRLAEDEFDTLMQPVRERNFPSGEYSDGAENIGQHFYFKRFISAFPIEMTRSVREMLKAWQEK